MADAQRALKKIAEGSVPDEVRRKAQKSYDELQDSAFYPNFYEEFRAAPDVDQLFKSHNINMDEQHKKLHAAVGQLLNFRPTDYPNPMLRHAESHERLGLQPKHFEHFRDAFLTALSRKKADNYAMDAWRAIFDAGIAYMTTKRANGHQKVTKAHAHSVNQERSITLVRSDAA